MIKPLWTPSLICLFKSTICSKTNHHCTPPCTAHLSQRTQNPWRSHTLSSAFLNMNEGAKRLGLYCGDFAHCVSSRPSCQAGSKALIMAERTPTTSRPLLVSLSKCLSFKSFKLDVQIRLSELFYILSAMIDFGAARNSMDSETMQRLHIPTKPLQQPECPGPSMVDPLGKVLSHYALNLSCFKLMPCTLKPSHS